MLMWFPYCEASGHLNAMCLYATFCLSCKLNNILPVINLACVTGTVKLHMVYSLNIRAVTNESNGLIGGCIKYDVLNIHESTATLFYIEKAAVEDRTEARKQYTCQMVLDLQCKIYVELKRLNLYRNA